MGRNILKISTVGGITFPEVAAIKFSAATMDLANSLSSPRD
ncbi:hypothetical protein GXM_05560 [Nostoc sphaeroides CCNUC1]|uniref:Uncharacterized protein n=1 Tax=Nostoc sphaeroides CCNUC1 TaxID=2653204 RepID=A0A5P8W5R9_9NOSO|nr:hypothetical protein GXM_05560 [Nostoc sphaeroides CCNUC1]